jgi:ribosomal protein L11 methyltransferase
MDVSEFWGRLKRLKWHELTIRARDEAVEMVTNFLHELEADGVSVEESWADRKPEVTKLGEWYDRPLNAIPAGWVEIKGWFLEGTDMAAVKKTLQTRIGELPACGIDPGDYSLEEALIDEEDWAESWKQYFKPIRVSGRLTIRPTWEPYEPGPGELVIDLDPGMAFGTGTHATTALCLRALDRIVHGGEDVIDVGTGSGILAIGAVKLGARNVLALDLDPVAVTSAKANAELNGLAGKIDVRESDLLGVLRESETSAGKPFNVSLPVDLVVANILAEIILRFIGDVYAALKPGGLYVASGIFTNKEQDVRRGLEAAGFEIVSRDEQDDWIAFTARKPGGC